MSPVSSTIIEIGATPVSIVDTIANIFRAVRSFVMWRMPIIKYRVRHLIDNHDSRKRDRAINLLPVEFNHISRLLYARGILHTLDFSDAVSIYAMLRANMVIAMQPFKISRSRGYCGHKSKNRLSKCETRTKSEL